MNQTKIKTEQGSIIADLDSTSTATVQTALPHSKSMFNHPKSQAVTSKRAVQSAGNAVEAIPKSAWAERVIELDASQMQATALTEQTPFAQLKPTNIDESWMPTWFRNNQTTQEEQEGKFHNFPLAMKRKRKSSLLDFFS